MNDLTYTLRQLCQRNRDNSHATQGDRLTTLTMISRQLLELGFRQMRASSLNDVVPKSSVSTSGCPHRNWSNESAPRGRW